MIDTLIRNEDTTAESTERLAAVLALLRDIGPMSEDIPAPALFLDMPLLVKGFVTTLVGLGGSGKTMLAYGAIVKALKAKINVLLIDEEMSLALSKPRLRDLGVTDEDAAHLFYGDRLLGSLGTLDEQRDAIYLLVKEKDIQLIVLDSFSKLLATFNGAENSNDDCRAAMGAWITGLSRIYERTVLVLDHMDKKDKGRGGRGGAAKTDDTDILWHATMTRPCTPTSIGSIALRLEKNRVGANLPLTLAYKAGGNGNNHLIVEPATITVASKPVVETADIKQVSALYADGNAKTLARWVFASEGVKTTNKEAVNAVQHAASRLIEKGYVAKADKTYSVTDEGIKAYKLGSQV